MTANEGQWVDANGWSRRGFLKGAAALGVAGGATGILQACGGDDEPASTGKKGGTLRFGMVDFFSTDTLDPAQAISSFALIVGTNVFEPLTVVDDTFAAQPLLAESFEPSADATEWTFRLRSGVEFHDGKAVDADDVIYTFQRQFEEKTAATFLSLLTGFVNPKRIEAVDKRTVRFTLDAPNAFLPAIFATPSFAIVQAGTTDFAKPPGTGPFKVQEYTPGERCELRASKTYWRSGRPLLDGLRITRIPDPATKVQAVISGDLDLVDAIEYNQLTTVDQASSVEQLVVKDAMFIPVSCDQTQAPFKDVRVRQAMKLAVDRERWVNSVLGGEGQVTADVPVPPSDPFYPQGIEQWPHDPERARSLLKQAGIADGLDLSVYTAPTGPGEVDAGVAFAEMVKEAGINAKVVSQTGDKFFAESFLVKPCVVGWLLRESAAAITKLVYTSDASIPQSQFKSKQFDSSINAALSSLDEQEQKNHFADAFAVMNEQAGEVIPAHGAKVFVRKNNVQGVELGYFPLADFGKATVA